MEVINKSFLKPAFNYKKGIKGFASKPLKEIKKHRLVVKLDDDQMNVINAYMEAKKLNRTNLVMNALLHYMETHPIDASSE